MVAISESAILCLQKKKKKCNYVMHNFDLWLGLFPSNILDWACAPRIQLELRGKILLNINIYAFQALKNVDRRQQTNTSQADCDKFRKKTD